jgi:cell wall-associated NlpC family hydrolase
MTPLKGYHARALACLAVTALLAVGCSRAPRPADPVAATLRAEVERWRAAPDAPRVDCSGFVAAVYRRTFGLQLPRSSEEMARFGRPVERGELRPGDLVFFRPPHAKRHVGFYVGEGEFGHVSASSGVRVSRLSEAYWRRAYWTARRVLDDD